MSQCSAMLQADHKRFLGAKILVQCTANILDKYQKHNLGSKMPPFHQTMVTSISDVMSKRIESIAPSDNAQKAAKKMRDKNVSSLVVVDNGSESPLGILTERDLVRRVCAERINGNDMPVKKILSSPLVTIDPESSIEVAASVMTGNRVRHLLVVDSKRKPIGILTPSDFTKYLKGLVDLDEVNARILESLMEETDS